MGIENIDPMISKMGNLQVLNLSYNKLTSIPLHLPPKLQELNLTGNMITHIEAGSATFPSLIHLGVSYNQLTDDSLTRIAAVFPKIFCLDISHNRLESMI
jgi:Leucine-rich repeat (LRR) protein